MTRRVGFTVWLGIAWLVIYQSMTLALNLVMRFTGREYAFYFDLPYGLWSLLLGCGLLVAGIVFVLAASRHDLGAIAAVIVIIGSGLLRPLGSLDASNYWGITVFVMLAPTVAALIALAVSSLRDGNPADIIAVAAVALWHAVAGWLVYGSALNGLANLIIRSDDPAAFLAYFVLEAIVLSMAAVAIARIGHHVGATSPFIYRALAFGAVPAIYFRLSVSWILPTMSGRLSSGEVVASNAVWLVGAILAVVLPAVALWFVSGRITRLDAAASCPTSAST